jgi:hypothetical protein
MAGRGKRTIRDRTKEACICLVLSFKLKERVNIGPVIDRKKILAESIRGFKK